MVFTHCVLWCRDTKDIINEINNKINHYATTFTFHVKPTFPFILITKVGYKSFNTQNLIIRKTFVIIYLTDPNALFKKNQFKNITSYYILVLNIPLI